MNSFLIFSIGFLLGLVFCLLMIYWRTKTNPFRIEKIQPKTKDRKTDFKQVEPGVPGEAAPDEFMKQVFSLIHDHIEDDNFCVKQLAHLLFLSRSQLFRKIKERTGRSPSDVLRKCKLEKAHNLLQNPELNVTQVAYKTGFKDLAHFSKCFSKEFGLTPKRIKQQFSQVSRSVDPAIGFSIG